MLVELVTIIVSGAASALLSAHLVLRAHTPYFDELLARLEREHSQTRQHLNAYADTHHNSILEMRQQHSQHAENVEGLVADIIGSHVAAIQSHVQNEIRNTLSAHDVAKCDHCGRHVSQYEVVGDAIICRNCARGTN